MEPYVVSSMRFAFTKFAVALTVSNILPMTTHLAAEKIAGTEKITLGAGCFWCTEAVMERVEGVKSAVSGYMGGHVENPTYRQVVSGETGHAEVAQIHFDPKVISLDEVLDIFWLMHDPTTLNRQGADVGTQYRSAIYYHNDEQREIAEKSIAKLAQSGKFADPIVTEVTKAETFYTAEDYHQEYYELNKNAGYCRYVIHPKLKKLGFED